jgi:two-component system NtrC family sensor kinase
MGLSEEEVLRLADLQYEITRLGFQVDADTLQKRILQGLCQVLGAEMAALFLPDETNDEWIVRKSLEGRETAVDAELTWSHQVDSRNGKGLVRECLRTATPVFTNRIPGDGRFDPSSDAPAGLRVRSMLCAPLMVEGEVLGVVQLLNKSLGDFTTYDRDLLVMIASQAAISLKGTGLIQQIISTNAELETSRQGLAISRDMLRALFDNLPMALYIISPDYRILAINKFRSRQVDQSPQSLVGQVCYQALFNRIEPCHNCRVMETFKDGASTQRTERRDQGEPLVERERWSDAGVDLEINTYPILSGLKEIDQAILLEQDVTEKHNIEDILARSERLAVIGQLAAGVAHEINNPLTAIIANAQILKRGLPVDDDLQESVDLISRAGARATQVVRNLLDFARKEDYHLGMTDVNETVEGALELIGHELVARGVHLSFKPDQRLPPILASENHLQSVWLNLLLNAFDAMDKDPAEVKVTTRKAGDSIFVTVTDNGKGIPADRLTRIFEPFYTTKAPGRGTGLGLSVSHRIVKQHGGHIRVESKVGIGSEFTVILPVG